VVLDVTERKHAEDALRENEARQRSILEHLPVGVWFVDAAANLLYANPAGSKIWGGDRFVHSNEYNNYRGKWHDTSKPLTPDDWAGARALKKGETSLRELIDIECFDGRQKTILNSAVPVRGKAGEITGAVIFNEDVSDLVAAQRALLESEQEFKAFFELSSVGAAEVDPVTNCFTRVNRKFCEITGYSEAELLKLGPLALTAPEEREKDVAQGKRLFSRETNDWQSEKRYLRKDGTLIWVQVTGTVLRRADGVPQRFLAVIQDITSRRQSQELMRSEAKRMEKLVEARTAKLQETVAELEAFAYSISHDLRAPLRALNSFSEALQQDYAEKLDDTAKHYLRRMGAACQRMDKLILDVLAYSRIVRQEIVLEPVDLHKLVRGLLDSFPHLQASQADIQIEGTLPQVVSSETALTQCISNLLGNAVKFVPAGTKPVVRIWSETREDGLYLLVRDNGIGIAPENEKRIFQLFQQLNKGYDGTGIGLSIVRKAIERLGGSVGVQSQPGKGSCFWLKLPLKDPAADGLDFSEKPALGI
jgi:PAS domain S-box-containing protein